MKKEPYEVKIYQLSLFAVLGLTSVHNGGMTKEELIEHIRDPKSRYVEEDEVEVIKRGLFYTTYRYFGDNLQRHKGRKPNKAFNRLVDHDLFIEHMCKVVSNIKVKDIRGKK